MLKKQRIKKACRYAIRNVYTEGITDVDLFNRPFELEFLKDDTFVGEICTLVTNAILKNDFSELKVHKIGHILIPKKSLSDFRKCALVEIYDEIVYLTLVLLIAEEVERMRIPKNNKRVFSYRLSSKKDNYIFDSKYNYTSFRNEVTRKSAMKKNKVVVECDIANFYDRLNIHRIESILRSSPNIDKDIIKLINELLLYWANRDSYGLPVGSNASRILAEVALIEVDNFLISKNIDFCRFVDDYRIFTKDAFTAHSHLAILINCLSREGICLNTQKTKIKDISQNHKIKVESKKVDFKSFGFSSEVGKIIRGYNGLIPTKFRELSESQKNKLKENHVDEMIKTIKNEIVIEPEELKNTIKTIVAQERFELLVEISNVLEKFPQFVPYYVDVMIKKGNFIEEKLLDNVQEYFSKWLSNDDTPEYIQVYLVRLFASPIFNNKRILLETFRKLKRNSGDYIGRALLEALDGKLSRGELLEIREYYYRADKWEERQIIKLINDGFSEGEKRPFYKDVRIHNNDIWIQHMLNKKK